MVAHTCNPNTLRGWGRRITRSRDQDHPGQHGETLSLLKIQKLARHGGKPVVPATQEAEAGGSLEPGRLRLQWAEITPLHSSSAWWQSKTLSQNKKQTNKTLCSSWICIVIICELKKIKLNLKTLSRGFKSQEIGSFCYQHYLEGLMSYFDKVEIGRGVF